ncbi:winged helix-turn-helix domain-containing protein [Haloarcula sp. CBA1127]|uniref:helix-turn-helix transcriptional regulator n=1 Tax=Haloarcula sp. CBA1127 TaxID=1765055 RepID=UPI00073EDADF|nr:transcriptional regulator FilR1 domain-containing protein [Haloarcula sp. CBA1127]
MGVESLIQYVRTSSVRTDIIGSLCPGAKATNELLSAVTASESAIYDALSNLEGRGLVTSMDDGWQLTGTGRLVADTIHRQQRLEELFAMAPQYWESHDTSVLPHPFRCRLPELDEYTVIRSTQTDINRPVREVVTRVENVSSCDVVSPVYHPEYEAAMPDSSNSRLVVSCAVVDEMLGKEDVSLDTDRYEETIVRVTPVPYALAVADDWMILTLPELDGAWPSAKIVSEADSAISWAKDLFTHLWEDATPIETYLADH